MIGTKKLLVIAGGNYIYGAEKVTLDVMEGLHNNGYEICAIISGWGDGEFARRLEALKIKYDKLKLGWYYTSKILWSFDSFIHYPGAIIKFLLLRKKWKDWPVYIITFRQVILLWPFFKKNIVYHVHDLNSTSKQSRFFLKIIDRKTIKYIAVSEFIKRDLISCGIDPEKIEVIHNGVEVESNYLNSDCENNDLTIGIIGQVIPRKGHEDVIEALKILADKGIKCIKLKIVGEGGRAYKEMLTTLIAKYKLESQIIFLGFQKTQHEIYMGIDIVVAVTRNDEPFALVPLEANALGKSAIVTNKGGFTEMIIDGYNGFIVESCNSNQIAEKIELLINNRQLLREMGENGKVNIEKNFTKERMNKKIKKLIDSI